MSTNSEVASMWGGLATRGVIAVIFGIAAVFWPGLTLTTLVYIFSAFILVSGVVGLVTNLTNVSEVNASALSKGLRVVVNLVEVGVGVYLLRHPHVSFRVFVLLIALALVVRGVLDVAASLFGDQAGGHKALTFLIGLLAVIAGVIIALEPASGGVAFVWVLGVYALVAGPLMIALAYDIKEHTK